MTALMTKEEHIECHKVLHKHFDRLLADFIDKTSKNLSQTSVLDLVDWSYKQTINPTPDTLSGRIQSAAEWCQQTEYEFIRAGILDRLDDVETVMLGWDEDREETASPLEGGD